MEIKIKEWKKISQILSNVQHWEDCPDNYIEMIGEIKNKHEFIR